jgi:hypothetical protein
MDIIEFLHGIGAELLGLNSDPKARESTLRYVQEETAPRIAEALEQVRKELGNVNSSARET